MEALNRLPAIASGHDTLTDKEVCTSKQDSEANQIVLEVAKLRSEMAGIKTALRIMQGSAKRTVMGRIPSLPLTVEQQKHRSLAMHTHRQEEALRRLGVNVISMLGNDPASSHSLTGSGKPTSVDEPEVLNHIHKSSTKPVPAGREEAAILCYGLNELLPQGVIRAKYRKMNQIDHTGVQARPKCLDKGGIRKDFELIDMIMEELGLQIASNCLNRAEVLEQLRRRFMELFETLLQCCHDYHEHHHCLRKEIKELENQNMRCHCQFKAVKEANKVLEEKLRENEELVEDISHNKDTLQESMNESIDLLQKDRQVFEREAQFYALRMREMEKEKDKHTSEAVSKIEDDLATVTEERDHLQERIQFMDKQLKKMREQRRRIMTTSTAAQTESLGYVSTHHSKSEMENAEETMDTRCASTAQYNTDIEENNESCNKTADSTISKARKGKKKKENTRRKLGGFVNLILTDKVGRMKGRQWVLKNISQIYVDKVVADKVDARDHEVRWGLCEYVHHWHLNRYGLRNLAEINLLDLITSVQAYAQSSTKIRIFGEFCRVLESDAAHCELDAINFYLVCLQHIAHPSGIGVLFPENSDDGACSVKHSQAAVAARSIFRELEDPDAARGFISQYIDTAQNMQGGVDVDRLMGLLVTEWIVRREANTHDLGALLDGGDRDDDGALALDEFMDVMHYCMHQKHGKTEDATIMNIFRDAAHIQEHGSVIERHTFLTIARKHDLGYWKLEYNLPHDPDEEKNALQWPSSERILSGVRRRMSLSIPPLLEQISSVKQLSGGQDGKIQLDQQYNRLKQLLSRGNGEAAYCALGILLEKIKKRNLR